MDLLDFGFNTVGTWSSDPRLKSRVRFNLSSLHGERVIYAFGVDDAVKYIGICDNTDTTLKDRLSRYQGMMGGSTNKRIAALIREHLSHGRTVRILAWRPESIFQVKELKVDLVKGLENPLIQALRPEWNIHS